MTVKGFVVVVGHFLVVELAEDIRVELYSCATLSFFRLYSLKVVYELI
jgi:hypothetical protein